MHMQSEPPYVTTYRKRRPSKTPRHHKHLSQSPMAETSYKYTTKIFAFWVVAFKSNII